MIALYTAVMLAFVDIACRLSTRGRCTHVHTYSTRTCKTNYNSDAKHLSEYYRAPLIEEKNTTVLRP